MLFRSVAPFAAGTGIVLNEVDPSVEATIRWRSVIHNGLPTNTAILYVARIRYDDAREDAIASNELNVRAAPLFANAIPGLPFGLDGVVGPGLGSEQRALFSDRFIELPPATPVADGNGAPYLAQLAAGNAEILEENRETAGTLATFQDERLARTLRFLREARFGTLVTHLFVIRAFLPSAIGDARSPSLDSLRESLHEELDRLFIKLRLPNYAIAPRDVETPSLRATVEQVLHEASQARGIPEEASTASTELRGSFHPVELREMAECLRPCELAAALPWSALARLLPDETNVFNEYRTRLIETLDALADSDSADFLEALQHRAQSSLDEALEALTSSLRATV